MKKLIYYLIFLLALLMMLLACSACRSPKTVSNAITTSDSLRLSIRDSTTNHFLFTFDSLLFSNTYYTDLTDEAAIPSGRLSVQSVQSVFNKNIPCSRLIVYGGRFNGETSRWSTHDSTTNKTSSDVKTYTVRSPTIPSTLPLRMAVIVIVIVSLLYLRKKRISQ